MKILFIKRTLDRSELELALDLHARGIDIHVMTPSSSIGCEQLRAKGIYIEPKPYKSKINLPLIRQIRALVKAEDFTIIHATDGKSLANAIFATYFLPVKIISYRGTLARIRKYDPSYWLGILNPRVERIFCVNQSILDYLQTLFPRDKLVLNYKGYAPEWSEEGLTEIPVELPELPPGAFVVMYIAQAAGRPYKGLNILIDAIHQIDQPDIHLVHIGSHDTQNRSRATSGPAQTRIHLLGMRPNAVHYLKQAQVFVLPSTRDGLPRVIKEAMACSLPVICTNIPGPTDLVIDQQTGLLVEPGSAEALKRAILQLYHHPEWCQQWGANGRQLLLDAFSTQAFADKTLAIYQELATTP